MADVEVLTGARVRLRRPVVDDAEAIFAELSSDPGVTRYMSWTTHRDVDETRDVITDLFNVGDEPTWLIERRDTDELVGTCGWSRPQPHSVDFGYCLCRKWWRQGLGSEVAGMLVEAAIAQSRRVPGLGVLPRRQRGVGGCAAALRPKPRRPARAVSRISQSRCRTPGLLVVREGGAVMSAARRTEDTEVNDFHLRELTRPVIVAPMAGGPSTPELAAAGSSAGGLGFVPGGYLTAEVFADRITAARRLTTGPLGANLFVPGPSAAIPAQIESYAQSLAEEAESYDVALGEPRFDDDAWAGKVEVVMDLKPEVVSFTFGLPEPDEVARMRGAGIYTVATVTTLAEAELAVACGVDALAAQGPAAGGHRGTFDPVADPASQPLAQLLHAVIVGNQAARRGGGRVDDGHRHRRRARQGRGGGPAGDGVPAR